MQQGRRFDINKAKQLGATVVKNKQEILEGYHAVLEY